LTDGHVSRCRRTIFDFTETLSTRAVMIAQFYDFVIARYQGDVHELCDWVVAQPVDEFNKPSGRCLGGRAGWPHTCCVHWNLRMKAAERGIWKSTELRRMLATAGLEISAGKMSGWWTGTPNTVKLDDLDVICVVLNCEPSDLLIPEPDKVRANTPARPDAAEAASAPSVNPRSGDWRTPLHRSVPGLPRLGRHRPASASSCSSPTSQDLAPHRIATSSPRPDHPADSAATDTSRPPSCAQLSQPRR
jgi:putative transcriptional regulator